MTFAAIMASDLGALFAEFGVAATYKVGGQGAGTAVTVLFDNPAYSMLEMETTNPTAALRASEVAAPAMGDTVTIGAAVFTVAEVQPASDGLINTLQLQK